MELLEWVIAYLSAGSIIATDKSNAEASFTNRRSHPDAGPSWPAARGLPDPRPYDDRGRARVLHEDGEHVRKLCHADVALLLQACDLPAGDCDFEIKIAEPRPRRRCCPGF